MKVEQEVNALKSIKNFHELKQEEKIYYAYGVLNGRPGCRMGGYPLTTNFNFACLKSKRSEVWRATCSEYYEGVYGMMGKNVILIERVA